MPYQFSDRVFSQVREVIQALASCRVQNHKALYEGRLIIAALALLDRHIPLHARGQSQGPEGLHQHRNPGQRRDALLLVSFVVFEAQALLRRREAVVSHRLDSTSASHPPGDNLNHSLTAAHLTSTATRCPYRRITVKRTFRHYPTGVRVPAMLT